MRLLWAIPLIATVLLWGLSHFYKMGFTVTISHRQILMGSHSGGINFEYGPPGQDRFFEFPRDFGSRLIDNRSFFESLRGGFLLEKYGTFQILRVPYWTVITFISVGTISIRHLQKRGANKSAMDKPDPVPS